MKLGRYVIAVLTMALTLLAIPQTSRAQVPSDEVLRSLATRVEEFLRDVDGPDMRARLDTLLSGSPLVVGDQSRVRRLQDTIERELPKYGPFSNKVEPLKVERIGTSVVRCVYLYHCKNFPVVWYLTFYKSGQKSEWVVIALKFDVDYDKLSAPPPKAE